MTLIMSLFAAIVCTVIWYVSDNAKVLNVGVLCYMFWGASIMWCIDAVFEYSELKLNYFSELLASCADDAFLGLMIIVLAMFIWICSLFIKDPLHHFRKKG